MARYTDLNNYFLFLYEDDQIKIRKKVGGALTTLVSKPYTLQPGVWYTFKGVVSGTTLTFAVNGVQELSASSLDLPAGKVGLVSFNGDVRYDNVIVNRLPKGSLDEFGIARLYPSVGREWFNAWNQGQARTLTWGEYATDPELVCGDGTYTIYGSSGPRAGQMQVMGEAPRVYVRDSDTEQAPPPADVLKWNNVEITFYAYSTGNSGVPWAGIEAVAKTNHLPDSWDCATRGYGGRMLFDGRLDFEKEVSHTNGINVQHSVGNWTGGLPLRRWIGYKFVARNINAGNDGSWENDTRVQLELYRDLSIGDAVNPPPPANGGTWELLGTFIDDGSWSTGFGRCVPPAGTNEFNTDRAAALVWPNWSVYLRTDGLTADIPQYYKWLSVREIAPIAP
jgi:hypothetical protein